ncbi:DUF2975 domain-containing protein [Scandinavium sp. TWS1a]|uniref:DUF2975 domain-containing protein n=1 Tax=Scandinavium tedordense TaxID=2926521 RepID=UPI002165D088|nr:DUF2975 domain-containing protein [Scandinavium tedordense]MCS2169081.1 DUF2975 domain-containing protein [Scandinavium tedordense]
MSEDNNNSASLNFDLLQRLQTAEGNLRTASAALESGAEETPLGDDEPETIQDVVDDIETEEEDSKAMQRLDLSSLNFQIAELSHCVNALKTNLEDVQAETARKNAETDGVLTDNELRKSMADKTYSFMKVWCTFVGCMIFLYVLKKNFEPPETVIIALMGTTTVSIVGLVGFVVSGLFKSGVKPGSDKKE